METRWIRSGGVVWEELDGEALLVSPENGTRWLLNAAAAAIWQLCDGRKSNAELTAVFAEASGRGWDGARDEIARFCGQFGQMGLLQAATSGCPILGSATATVFRGSLSMPPAFRSLGLGFSAPRRRASPRGNSGPG